MAPPGADEADASGEEGVLVGADVRGAAHDPRKPVPLWSVARITPSESTSRALLPALIAGLPGSRAMVRVGPPLLRQRGQAEAGETGQDDVAVGAAAIPPEPPGPIRSYFAGDAHAGDVAGPAGADIVGDDRVVQHRRAGRPSSPPPPVAVLPLTVQPVSVAVPA